VIQEQQIDIEFGLVCAAPEQHLARAARQEEIHWYQAHSVGRMAMKIKALL
jgi:hypothetical protein